MRAAPAAGGSTRTHMRRTTNRRHGSGARLGRGAVLFASLFAGAAIAEPAAKDDDLSLKRLQLRGVEDSLGALDDNRQKLETDMRRLREERESLNRTMLEAADKLRGSEERAAGIEARLADVVGKEEAATASLERRRGAIGEVLMALQRMGRHPPPALLARPDDILEALRASLTLGAVLPQMRGEAESLRKDLADLVHLRQSVKAERAKLAVETDELKGQRERLGGMIDMRQKALEGAKSALDAGNERARVLASQAGSLKDLIARMEADSEAARKGAQAAREADAARAAADAQMSREQRARALAAPFKDAARLAPAAAFADLRGKLTLPAAGAVLRRFGASDGFGGTEKGLSIAARENGAVSAPCDGWVVFAGIYRSYGQLLIINAGAGYYVVMAGMSRIHVNVGQFVLAGEPVASMGDGATRTAATVAIGAKQPVLYVEFRKDGASIDSGPWWARADTGKSGKGSDIRKVGG